MLVMIFPKKLHTKNEKNPSTEGGGDVSLVSRLCYYLIIIATYENVISRHRFEANFETYDQFQTLKCVNNRRYVAKYKPVGSI